MQVRWTVASLLIAPLAMSCVLTHVTKDIPPPGGCDGCHRAKISSNWEVGLAPVTIGEDGRPPEQQDRVMRELRELPYHERVPDRRLEVFAAAVTPELVGEAETGIQCFVCHRSPEAPHQGMRGSFHHPWGQPPSEGK